MWHTQSDVQMGQRVLVSIVRYHKRFNAKLSKYLRLVRVSFFLFFLFFLVVFVCAIYAVIPAARMHFALLLTLESVGSTLVSVCVCARRFVPFAIFRCLHHTSNARLSEFFIGVGKGQFAFYDVRSAVSFTSSST